MKILFFAMMLVIAGGHALPHQEIDNYDNSFNDQEVESRESIIVVSTIRRIINEIRNGIRDAGLDPLVIDNEVFTIYEVPFLANIRATVESLRFTGASNIAINRLDFNVFVSRLSFDFSLPELFLSIGNVEVNANILGQRHSAQLRGSLSIRQIRIAGQVTVRAGIISGVNIRSLSFDFTLGGVTSDLTLVVLGNDYSSEVNTVLNDTIPDFLRTYRNEINKMIEDYVWSMLNSLYLTNI